MVRRTFTPGDRVVYRKEKHSVHPGPRAVDVSPAPRGEEYHYAVEKFWTVAGLLPDGTLRLVTRRGKVHVVAPDDPRLRPASLWERLRFASRFPRLDELPIDASGPRPVTD